VSSSRWRPYLLLAAFVAAALAPVPWLIRLVGVAGVLALALRAGRLVGARRAVDLTGPGQALVLGSDRRGREVSIGEHELSAHGLILGASGTGKTTTLLGVLDQLIACGRPVVVIDMKGSPAFARSVAASAAAAGRPFKLWTPDGPGHWNPLEHGNATELKDKLIATERFTEPHYQRAAERYVQTALQVIQARGDEAPTLAKVVQLMDPVRLRGSLRGLPSELRERVQDYLSGLTADQLSAVRGLQTRLAILTESHTGRLLEPARNGETIDLRAALNGPEVVMFSLNSSTYGKLAGQLGTLAVQDLICAAGHRLEAGLTRDQAYVVIDEASVLGGDHILALFARGREAGVGVLAVTQELADFDRAAPGLRDQVLGNTAIKLAHRQDVPSSAQTIAQLAGTEEVWEETQRIGGPLTGAGRGGGTRRRTEQFVIHPNEIKRLQTGEAVLISKLRSARPGTIRVRPVSQHDSGIRRTSPRQPPGAERE
jgi:conjugal transfer pilus assembly protein TraD